jgi:hypothetical protein
LYPREERLEIERRLRDEPKSPASNDPEAVALVDAAKQWRKEQEANDASVEESGMERYARMMKEAQADLPSIPVPVARSASFADAQAMAQQKAKPSAE